MKFRCVHNSIRFRVRKSDIQAIEDHGRIEETVQFPGEQTLTYSLQLTEKGDTLIPSFNGKGVIIEIPVSLALPWFRTNQVGIEQDIDIGNGEKLHILIEKDFPCKDREEDTQDTFWELAEDKADQC